MMRRIASVLFALHVLAGASTLRAQRMPDSVTVPLIMEGNRPYVLVTFERADGSTRSARMLLDTGGGGFLLTEPLARDLGLSMGPSMREEGREFAPVTSPVTVRVGALPLSLNVQRIAVTVGRDNILPTVAAGHAEGMLPGHVLSQYHVVFDYPARTFTIAKPGILTPRGTALAMPVGRPSGFPRTEWVIDGTTYGMLLDTGASFTMVSEVMLKALGVRHPEWPRYAGAFGEAATLGGQTLETMMVPRAQWGVFALNDVGITSQREGTFERYMSGMMRGPIMGSLAGNVLTSFRVELDYAHERLYLSRQ
jgi:predicted aspartyl protease